MLPQSGVRHSLHIIESPFLRTSLKIHRIASGSDQIVAAIRLAGSINLILPGIIYRLPANTDAIHTGADHQLRCIQRDHLIHRYYHESAGLQVSVRDTKEDLFAAKPIIGRIEADDIALLTNPDIAISGKAQYRDVSIGIADERCKIHSQAAILIQAEIPRKI